MERLQSSRKEFAMKGRRNRTSYARVYGIYDKHCSIMVGLDTHDLGSKERKKRKVRASGRRAVKLAFTRKRNASKRYVGYAVSVECTFHRLSSERRKRLRREYDEKSNEMEGRENRTMVLSRGKAFRIVYM